jgi:hypothetical protein
MIEKFAKKPKNLGKRDSSWGIWGLLRFYLKSISLLHFFGRSFCPDFFVVFFLFDKKKKKKKYFSD